MNRSSILLPHATSQPPSSASARNAPQPARLSVSWARSEAEVREAQALRYQVFAVEMGARCHPGCAGRPGRRPLRRLLRAPAGARRRTTTARRRGHLPRADAGGQAGRRPLQRHRVRPDPAAQPALALAEIGRSCVHPDHRSGGAILALWGALAEFMAATGWTPSSAAPASACATAATSRPACGADRRRPPRPIDCQVRPRLPLPIEHLRQDLAVEPPALIRGYLRCGARSWASRPGTPTSTRPTCR
jgi:putative hemolysin